MNRFGKDNDSDHKTTVFRKKCFSGSGIGRLKLM